MSKLIEESSCYQYAAGKDVTADCSVIVARSEDAHGTIAQRIISVPRISHDLGETIKFSWGTEIPQARETYGYVSIVEFIEGEPIELNNGGINEFQVCAGSSR